MKYVTYSSIMVILALTVIAGSGLASVSYAAGQQDDSELVRLEVTTYPVRLPVVINGVLYTPGPGGVAIVNVPPGETVEVAIVEDVYYTAPGTRYVFKGWNNGASSKSISVPVDEWTTVIALYEKQYYVEVSSEYGSPEGSGWYPEGARVNLTVDDTVMIDDGVRAVFSSWSGGEKPGSSSGNYIYAFQPTKLTVSWSIEYLVEVGVEAPGSGLTTPITIGSGWYKSGSMALLEAQEQVNLSSDNVVRFKEWRVDEGSIILDDPASTRQLVTVEGPLRLTAVYGMYYLVSVTTPYGEATGGGLYEEGSKAVVSIAGTEEGGQGVRYVFSGWTGDIESSSSTIMFTVNKPMVIAAEWKKQYKLTINSEIPAVKGEGWYDEGSKASIRAEPRIDGRLGVRYLFQGWQGDYKGVNPEANIIMDSPKQVEALWSKSYMQLYSNIVAFLLVLGGGVAAYRRVLPRFNGSGSPEASGESKDK
ncbi:MAG: hypothetical protein GSR78_04610 [Desulfurococcales archaeon]|nr:hypothetical protein [Desulfurococcales archaeon]